MSQETCTRGELGVERKGETTNNKGRQSQNDTLTTLISEPRGDSPAVATLVIQLPGGYSITVLKLLNVSVESLTRLDILSLSGEFRKCGKFYIGLFLIFFGKRGPSLNGNRTVSVMAKNRTK